MLLYSLTPIRIFSISTNAILLTKIQQDRHDCQYYQCWTSVKLAAYSHSAADSPKKVRVQKHPQKS